MKCLVHNKEVWASHIYIRELRKASSDDIRFTFQRKRDTKFNFLEGSLQVF